MYKHRLSLGTAFANSLTEEDAEYICKIMNQIKLWGKPIYMNKGSNLDAQSTPEGANLFIGNLDNNVDEHLLYDNFNVFGIMSITAKVSNSSLFVASPT
ncbi:hypothetical protein K439DRAFT_1532166 [Ramaria rubella]|nr:hypothetical protein K439DRAFT_1532166 [Ramaria rubella]